MQGVKDSLEHMDFTYMDAHEADSTNVGEWHVAMLLPNCTWRPQLAMLLCISMAFISAEHRLCEPVRAVRHV